MGQFFKLSPFSRRCKLPGLPEGAIILNHMDWLGCKSWREILIMHGVFIVSSSYWGGGETLPPGNAGESGGGAAPPRPPLQKFMIGFAPKLPWDCREYENTPPSLFKKSQPPARVSNFLIFVGPLESLSVFLNFLIHEIL